MSFYPSAESPQAAAESPQAGASGRQPPHQQEALVSRRWEEAHSRLVGHGDGDEVEEEEDGGAGMVVEDRSCLR